MTAHKAFAIGTGIFLISFIAGANAGTISERLIILENLIKNIKLCPRHLFV